MLPFRQFLAVLSEILGWHLLFLFNIAYLLDPSTPFVFLFLNGLGFGLVGLSHWLDRTP